MAKRLTKEGNYDEAWRFVRLAVERLYVLVKIGSDPTFDHRSWKDQTATHMWGQGVAAVILARDSEAGTRLKRILEFAAGGVHDKPSRGATDLKTSITYLTELLTKLRLGSG
jgi:hypothetical protein